MNLFLRVDYSWLMKVDVEKFAGVSQHLSQSLPWSNFTIIEHLHRK